MLSTKSLAVSVLLVLVALPMSAATGMLEFSVRDSRTHYPVPATIKGEGPTTFSVTMNNTGYQKVQVDPGDYRLDISAPGYKPRRAHYGLKSGTQGAMTIMLDAQNLPPDERPEAIAGEIRSGFTLVHGYVVDAASGKPISGLVVQMLNADVETLTDSRGHYLLSVPNPESDSPSGWRTDTLIYQKSGYASEVFENFGIYGEEMGGNAIDLDRGTGTNKHDVTHKLMREDDTGIEPQQNDRPVSGLSRDLYQWLGTPGQIVPAGAATNAPAPAIVTVPNSVNVGSGEKSGTVPKSYVACAGKYTCTNVTNYSLENYVTQGLPGEWPAWWDKNSQSAGSVAYRSYGAWYVANPACGSIGAHGTGTCAVVYDICNTTACQVYNPWGFPPNTTSKGAVSTTIGVVLSSDGINVFKAEYAAESNLASDTQYATCGDGNIGEPSNNWPCMIDFVDKGKSQVNTHSRGMCQRGSQRWATGVDWTGANGDTKQKILNSDGNPVVPRDWRCILDHYYNANNNSGLVDPNIVSGLGQAGTGLRTAFMQWNSQTYGWVAYEAYDSSGHNVGIRAASAANGSGDYAITSSPGFYPSWEPGGTRLVYDTGNGLAVINSDGTGFRQLTTHSYDYDAAWSPLGDKIAFCSTGSGPWTHGTLMCGL